MYMIHQSQFNRRFGQPSVQ